ncbi:hypothetical protein [Proteus phage PM2]|uniref:Uncharacterized protein n=1 Tax=Proteus phage PM2 TaxID=2025809 RepID=A0A249XWP2_9CAUD|nr:hypothetical protein KNT71_gp248 [Proteus phage PM2]ASZ76384.1 hypothetical protein [Proteus phage PM2]
MKTFDEFLNESKKPVLTREMIEENPNKRDYDQSLFNNMKLKDYKDWGYEYIANDIKVGNWTFQFNRSIWAKEIKGPFADAISKYTRYIKVKAISGTNLVVGPVKGKFDFLNKFSAFMHQLYKDFTNGLRFKDRSEFASYAEKYGMKVARSSRSDEFTSKETEFAYKVYMDVSK